MTKIKDKSFWVLTPKEIQPTAAKAAVFVPVIIVFPNMEEHTFKLCQN